MLIQSMFFVTVAVAMCSLSIDIGIYTTARCELQRAADAAALAAAAAYAADGDWAAARQVARDYAGANPVSGVKVVAGGVAVTFGRLDNGAFEADQTPYTAVKVRIDRTAATGTAVKLCCSDLFGVGSVDTHATAVSRLPLETSDYNLVGVDSASFGSLGVLASINGRLVSNGNVSVGMPLGLFTGVTGDARSWQGTTRVGTAAYVTGSTGRLGEALRYPSVTLPTSNNNSRLTEGLDGAGNFTTVAAATVPAGVYVVNDLTLLAGVAMRLDGPVTFYVKNQCNIAASVNLLGDWNLPASQFKVRLLPGARVYFLANLLVPLHMDLYAPDTDIVIAVGISQFKGRLVGRTLSILLPVAGSFVEDRTLTDALADTRRAALAAR